MPMTRSRTRTHFLSRTVTAAGRGPSAAVSARTALPQPGWAGMAACPVTYCFTEGRTESTPRRPMSIPTPRLGRMTPQFSGIRMDSQASCATLTPK